MYKTTKFFHQAQNIIYTEITINYSISTEIAPLYFVGPLT